MSPLVLSPRQQLRQCCHSVTSRVTEWFLRRFLQGTPIQTFQKPVSIPELSVKCVFMGCLSPAVTLYLCSGVIYM